MLTEQYQDPRQDFVPFVLLDGRCFYLLMTPELRRSFTFKLNSNQVRRILRDQDTRTNPDFPTSERVGIAPLEVEALSFRRVEINRLEGGQSMPRTQFTFHQEI